MNFDRGFLQTRIWYMMEVMCLEINSIDTKSRLSSLFAVWQGKKVFFAIFKSSVCIITIYRTYHSRLVIQMTSPNVPVCLYM